MKFKEMIKHIEFKIDIDYDGPKLDTSFFREPRMKTIWLNLDEPVKNKAVHLIEAYLQVSEFYFINKTGFASIKIKINPISFVNNIWTIEIVKRCPDISVTNGKDLRLTLVPSNGGIFVDYKKTVSHYIEF